MSAEGRVEHQKLNQTTALLLFGWVFGVQLGSLEKSDSPKTLNREEYDVIYGQPLSVCDPARESIRKAMNYTFETESADCGILVSHITIKGSKQLALAWQIDRLPFGTDLRSLLNILPKEFMSHDSQGFGLWDFI